MTERLIMITIFGTGILGSLGGLFWKPARRYGIPLLYTIVSTISGTYNFKAFLMTLILCGALHLGYGENSGWIKKIIYAIGLSLPSLIIKFNFWAIILPVVFLGTYYLSNKPKWQYIFNWRICEALTYIFMGILYSQIL